MFRKYETLTVGQGGVKNGGIHNGGAWPHRLVDGVFSGKGRGGGHPVRHRPGGPGLPGGAGQTGNVLNVYFDQGSKHKDKKDKAKSLMETMKEQVMSNMLVQAMDPLAGMGMPGMSTGAFNPLSFLDS